MNNEPIETTENFAESEYLTPAENNAPKVLAILSMVFGILGFIGCCPYSWIINILFDIAAIVLAAIYKKKGGKNAMATVGMVLAIVATCVGGEVLLIIDIVTLAMKGKIYWLDELNEVLSTDNATEEAPATEEAAPATEETATETDAE